MEEEEAVLDEEEEGLNYPAIAIAVVLILGLIGAGIWYFFLREEKGGEEDSAPKVTWVAPTDLQEEVLFEFMPKLVINPADSRGRHFLVVKIDLALSGKEVLSQQLGKPWRLPQAQNIVIDVFSSYTIRELRQPEIKEEARLKIRDELNAMMGWIAKPEPKAKKGAKQPKEEIEGQPQPPIKDVYIVQYVMQ